MKHKAQRLLLSLAVLGALAAPAMSAGDLTRQDPVERRVELGTKDDAHRYAPSNLTFETGKLYKLVLTNPSKSAHYFSAPEFASKVYTRKVQVVHDGGRLAEIKGDIREIEVFPGGTTEWWFVPVATGTFGLSCGVKDADGRTHAEHGMVGTIKIE
jgi:uncharacterized cupredoxin-like copper-binding protein